MLISAILVMRLHNHIGKKIKTLRSIKKITQEELAASINKTRAMVSYLETTGKINKYTLADIAKALNTTPEAIEDFDIEDNNPKKIAQKVNNTFADSNQLLIKQLLAENAHLKETIEDLRIVLKNISKNR